MELEQEGLDVTRPPGGHHRDRAPIRARPSRRLAWSALGMLMAGGAYSCTDVSITTVEVNRIEVTPSEASLVPGGTMRLDAEVTDKAGRSLRNRDIVWESTNPQVVTVTFLGVVAAIGQGDATVIASSEGVTGSAAVRVGRPQADLAVTNQGTPNPVDAGDKLTYRIVVTNAGPSTATDVVVAESTAVGLALDSATPTRGSYDASLERWTVGSMLDGASETLTLVFRVLPGTQTPIRSSVAVTSGADDPNAADNVDTAVIAVAPPTCLGRPLPLVLCPR